MNRSILAIAFFSVALFGCSLAPGVVEQTSRDVAKGIVNSVIQQKFPGVNAAPYTDCIIDNASTDEILRLAQGAVAGSTDAATTLVLDIASRPATTQCLAQNALVTALG